MSILGLGTMMFGAWGNADVAECQKMVDVAIESGVTLFDTADIYDHGRSESILGTALGRRRAEVVVATKVGLAVDDDPDHRGNSPRWIAAAVEGSLRRLGSEWIDLYQCHRPDPSVPIAETIGALDALVTAGKIRAYGTSTFPADELVEAQWTARSLGASPPTTDQPPYSIFVRGAEGDVFPTCLRHGVVAITWAPLNGGWLTGKYRADGEVPAGSRADAFGEHIDVGGPFHRDKARLVDELTAIARSAGVPLTTLAIAFCTAHPAVASVLLGPKTPRQLVENLAASEVRLGWDVLDAIDSVVPPGHNVNRVDVGYVRPELASDARRRTLPEAATGS